MASYSYTFNSGDGVTPTRLNDARTVSEIVNADVSATAAIAATKLASDSITNTQIKSDAAIAGTKIAPNFGSQNVVTTGVASAGVAAVNTATTTAFLNIGSGSGQFPVAIQVYPSSHATSRRASVLVDDWALLQDTMGDGTKNFSIYQGSGNTSRVVIKTNGQVGIGTASPNYLLDVAGIVNTNTNFAVDGTQVVSSRRTGWSAATGTATRTAFATSSVTTAQLAERVKALIDDLRTHGLLGS